MASGTYFVARVMLVLVVVLPADAAERLRRGWLRSVAADRTSADAPVPTVAPEVCNGLDDDGNGAVDDHSPQAIAVLGTPAPADGFAASLGPAGDVNGDGHADLIVGAMLADNGENDEGRVYVFLGSASGLQSEPAWTAECNRADCLLGWSVASAGDVNGDGFDDVVSGALSYTNGQPNEGAVFVYLGSATGLPTSPNRVVEGEQNALMLGLSVAGAGDVNGDGFDDVIASSLSPERAWLWLGSPTGLAASAAWVGQGSQPAEGYGKSVAGAGDVNGDGYDDVIVGAAGAQSFMGRAYVYLGSAAGLAQVPLSVSAGIAGGFFGQSVSSAGDVDGDGRADVLVGAHNYSSPQSDEGRAYLFLGTSTGLAATPAWTVESNQAGARLGERVAAAGDLDHDGRGDVIVSAPFSDNGQQDEGVVLVYLGTATGLASLPALRLEGDSSNVNFGRSVAGAGDTDGDGTGELVVGRKFDEALIYRGAGAVTLGEATCGIGACERTVPNCIQGTPQVCDPGPPATETCNGIDDDCDGRFEQPVDGTPILGATDVAGSPSMSWTAVPGAIRYDMVRGDLDALRASAGDFTSAIRACEANDLNATSLPVPDSPASGTANFYLVRGRSCAGGGTYDSGAPSQSGSRDAGIQASPVSCPFLYITELTADPVAFLTGTPTAVTFQARVPAIPAAGIVSLVRGQDPAPLCMLVDDGQAANGDVAAGDGVFSCVVTFQEPLPARIGVHVRTNAGSSTSLTLDVVGRLTVEQAEAILGVQDAAFALWQQLRASHGDTLEARTQTAAAIAQLDGVSAAGVTPDGVNVWIDHDAGIQGGLLLPPPDSLGGPSTANGQHLLEPAMDARIPPIEPTWSSGTIDSRRVIVWDALAADLAPPPSPGPDVVQRFSQSACPPFLVTSLLAEQCTIESVKTFASYGIVVIAAHGAIDKDGAVTFQAGEPATFWSLISHSADLRARHVSGPWTTEDDRKVFLIRPSLIANLPGSPGAWHGGIVINSSCASASDDSMSSAFSYRGAQSYYGWTYYAWAPAAEYRIRELVAALIDSDATTGSALGYLGPNPLPYGYCTGNKQMLCDDDPSDESGATCAAGSCEYASLVLRGGTGASIPPGDTGAPCNSELPCCNDLYCGSGSVCRPCQDNGAVCASNEACCSDICSAGVCATCRPLGSACAGVAAECCNGICNGGVCTTCASGGTECDDDADCCNGNCYHSPSGLSVCYTGCNFGTACSQDSDCDAGCSVSCEEDPSDSCTCDGNPNISCQGCGPDGICN